MGLLTEKTRDGTHMSRQVPKPRQHSQNSRYTDSSRLSFELSHDFLEVCKVEIQRLTQFDFFHLK